MRAEPVGLGFSPCPNDTFQFDALVHGRVVVPGVTFEPFLADIEELNRRAQGDAPLGVTKLSMGALAAVADRYVALAAGAAIGRGVGPLVVTRAGAAAPRSLAELAGRRVAIPGVRTTAWLLLRMFAPEDLVPVELRFDRIMPAVVAGEVDAGLVIHESRFTYREHGLVQLADVGELWEGDTGLPLPLAVIAARRDLGAELAAAVGEGIRASVAAAFADPAASRAYVRAHSQELSDAVCDQHIALYVNAFSLDLGAEGRAAIDALLARGRSRGWLVGGSAPW